MKKKYMKPDMLVVDLKYSKILCGSITQRGDNLTTTFDDDEFESGQTIN